MQKTVRIRLKKNPEIKRTVTANAFANYPKDWELDTQEEVIQEPVKKKDAEDVATKEEDSIELESLREQYESKFGKPADKRMKVETLKVKLNESL